MAGLDENKEVAAGLGNMNILVALTKVLSVK